MQEYVLASVFTVGATISMMNVLFTELLSFNQGKVSPITAAMASIGDLRFLV